MGATKPSGSVVACSAVTNRWVRSERHSVTIVNGTVPAIGETSGLESPSTHPDCCFALPTRRAELRATVELGVETAVERRWRRETRTAC